MSHRAYPTDLTDAQWAILEPLVPPPQPGGRPPAHARRELINAMLYVLRGGIAWRAMPHDLPPWQTVYHYFRLWRLDGTWEHINAALRERVRRQAGRDPTPSAAIIDSQSVKTTEKGGARGYDGGKKLTGRKRHIVVDTEGLLLRVVVHAADMQDRDGGVLVLTAPLADCPRLCHLWVDAGYRGRFVDWVETTLTWSVEVVQHWWTGVRAVWVAEGAEPPTIPAGFHVLPRRWVVERTFAWLGRYRRLSKDYEALPCTQEAWIYLAMIRLMLARMAR